MKTLLIKFLKLFFRACKFFTGNKSFKTNNEIIFLPIFKSFDDMIDQVYRLTWYLPLRENVKIRIFYHGFEFTEKDLLNEYNRPWHMHTLPVNLKKIWFIKQNDSKIYEKYVSLIKVLGGIRIIFWEEPFKKSLFYKIIQLTGNVSVVDHKNCSYQSDINYVTIINNLLNPHMLEEIRDESKRIFTSKVQSLRKKYKKTYIWGRGPSLGTAFKYDFSDGARIVANQIVRDEALMNHINPNFIVACDHAWHFGCSKVADFFRKDVVDYVISNDAFFIVPLDSFLLLSYHYPQLRNKLIGIPYYGNEHNFNLVDNYYTKGSLGVLFEFLFPVACTLSKEIKMLGFDGKSKSQNPSIVYPYSDIATYPDEIDNSIHASRPGYYDRDFSDFRDSYDVLFKSMVDEAEAKGFEIETLAPSYHTALKDKFRGNAFNKK